MINYTSLRIVRDLENSWLYYPNGLATYFGISKGYFTFESSSNLLQIVEDGRSLRPKVLLSSIIFEDVYMSEAPITFTSYSTFQNVLTSKGCPLSVQVTSSGGGIPEAPINGIIHGRKDASWVPVPTGSGAAKFLRQIHVYDGDDIITLDDPADVFDIVNMNDLSRVIEWTTLDDETIQITTSCEVDDTLKIIAIKTS